MTGKSLSVDCAGARYLVLARQSSGAQVLVESLAGEVNGHRRYRPAVAACRVLITSRSPATVSERARDPAASSMTQKARSAPVVRQAGIAVRTLSTRPTIETNATSI